MKIERWRPRRSMGRQEKFLLKRVRKNRRLFAFLREYRQELFDKDFQKELEAMYRDTGAGKSPVVPALLAMATILQGYLGISDAEAVEMTVVDLRWQMVLDCLGSETPAFSQSTLVEFRGRLIRAEMDRRLLERTIALARTTKAFDWRKLPKNLRIAVDSSPLEGAGRVEDTINLLGHAARKLACCAAGLLDMTAETVSQRGGAAVLLASSVKPIVDEIITGGGEVVCKPWSSPNTRHRNAFTKADFRIDLARMTITCPAGESAEIEPGQTTEFDPEDCDICPLRCQCTNAAVGRGRSVRIAGDEILQHTLRKLSRRRRGRDRLRERAAVEHGLSHIGRVQGRRARYRDTYTKYP